MKYLSLAVILFVAFIFAGCTTTSQPTSTSSPRATTVSVTNTPVTTGSTSAAGKMSLRSVESASLDATFYVPSGWYFSPEITRELLAPKGEKIPCYESSMQFYKDPKNCKDGADTFMFGFNTDGKVSQWPNFDLSIAGPTSGLGGGCPAEEWDMSSRKLTVNGNPYTVRIGHNKTTGVYSDCFQWEPFTEAGAKSQWKEFSARVLTKSESDLNLMLNVLETAKFH